MVARWHVPLADTQAVRGILDHGPGGRVRAVEKARAIEEDSKKALRTAVRTGVRPVCGTTPARRSTRTGARRERSSTWWSGDALLDALRAATANGAELLRLTDVGTIEPGKQADLLLVDGDPMEDPRTLLARKRVWRAGRPV